MVLEEGNNKVPQVFPVTSAGEVPNYLCCDGTFCDRGQDIIEIWETTPATQTTALTRSTLFVIASASYCAILFLVGPLIHTKCSVCASLSRLFLEVLRWMYTYFRSLDFQHKQ